MQRQLMDELIAWKSRANRKPLLLKGARQTGKTWLLNEFAGQQYQNVIRFDFMLEPGARSLFDGSLDPKRIISQIELLRGQTITPTDTLIIFDEIQEAPRGITSLKYFNELAPEYHIVAAGSYMGLALRRENESFPVGKIDQLTMRPMGFVEFVRAVDGDPLADAILAADMDLLANVSEKLERLLKEYLVVGGMPEVVSAFAASHDFIEARRLQQQIIEAYESDFGKHAPARIVERMRLVWKSLPGQLAKENKKFVYGALRPGARARDFEESLQWLMDYGIVHKVSRVSALRAPLTSYEDLSGFKLFCIDTGILGALSGLSPAIVLNGPAVFTEFKGSLTEQYVAQELLLQGKTPAYWSSSSGNAETDFAVDHAWTVLPLEVKAAENLKAKSLRIACEKFKLERCVRTSLAAYRDEGTLVNIPLWEIGQIDKLA